MRLFSQAIRVLAWLLLIVAALWKNPPSDAEGARPDAEKQEFTAVDTSRLLGSPDPLPLTAIVAFPHLRFERPLELTHAGDDTNRLFVVEQGGVIRVFENDAKAQRADVFLDISDVVLRDGNEEGLLGLAFHPKYAENGQFFVYYSTKTNTEPRASHVSRFRVSKTDANRADRNSEEVLLTIPQPYSNHNGGSIQFGPDGYLYIGLGDGGLANDPHRNAQNLNTLLGSVLRIDVDTEDSDHKYRIPSDNPFVNRQPQARGEIWACGLRNPWRLSFDSATGELWTADVGQERYEEVNRIVRGGNYGWPLREGRHDFEPTAQTATDKLIEPLAEYFHTEGESITGGLVYRGARLPQEYGGAYFYADFESGNVWALRNQGAQAAHESEPYQACKVAATGLQISAFGSDAEQNMFLTAFDGRIYQLTPRDENELQDARSFPRKLSETGLFQSVKDLTPVKGLIPYSINVPFWSDFAVKDRYLALPKSASVKFHPREKWEFPVGTVFIKHFFLALDRTKDAPQQRLETRLFVHGKDGWAGYTYVWNEQQSEAHLIDEAQEKIYQIHTAAGPMEQRWHFPSRTECMGCHSKAVGFVLGLNTRQINRTQDYHGQVENQLTQWQNLGLFLNAKDLAAAGEQEKYIDWGEITGRSQKQPEHLDLSGISISDMARAYLDVNCVMCHHPDGIAGKVGSNMADMRFHQPLPETGLLERDPGQGQLSPPGSKVIAAGKPAKSELLQRMSTRTARQMPPIATHIADPYGERLLKVWIESLEQGIPRAKEDND